MPIQISENQLKEIAELLDCGMICFYHRENKELEYYPDPFKQYDVDEEAWGEVMDKVEENYQDYLRFEPMSGTDAFRVMEDFVATIPSQHIQYALMQVLSRRKPFQGFNHLLLQYPHLREQWFVYKSDQYIKFVREQIEEKD
ncbi:MAG: UPF0158 family protein [Bacteroidota bacterium]